MASEHTALIKFTLDTAKQLPFADRCRLRKIQSGKVRVGSRYIDLGEADWPDCCGYNYLGHFVSLEFKVGPDKLSEGQKAMRDSILSTDLGLWFQIGSKVEALNALKLICNL